MHKKNDWSLSGYQLTAGSLPSARPFPVYLDVPVSSPAVANGAGCVPDSNESPAVSSQVQAQSAIDLFNSLPAPCPSSSAKTMVGGTHTHTPLIM